LTNVAAMSDPEINGHRLHVERRGKGDPLLLIMGLSGNTAHWGDPFVELLERDFEVIAYDHRGTGRSAPVSAPFTITDLADDAAALLDTLELDRVAVLGISMGGMVAQELALAHPDRVATLILGCTYAGGEGSTFTDQATIERLAEPVMSGDRERATRAGWEVNVSKTYAAERAHWEAFRRMVLERPTTLSVIMQQLQAITDHDTSRRLPELKVPTLVVHGTEDEMLPVANARAIAEAIPDARLEIFEGVGHLFFWEQPERTAELVRDFVRTGQTARP